VVEVLICIQWFTSRSPTLEVKIDTDTDTDTASRNPLDLTSISMENKKKKLNKKLTCHIIEPNQITDLI